MRYTANEINKWEFHTPTVEGKWVPARPVNHEFDSFIQRVKDAFGVLRGKYDALDWEEEE